MSELVPVYAGEEPPTTWQGSIFVAGPMPRDPDLPSWRPEAIDLLKAGWDRPGTLVVFIPEARDRHHPTPGYISQLWEERWTGVVDVILFWVPRDMQTLPGLNTNLEFGRNESSGRVVLGLPPHAVSVHYLRRAAQSHGIPVSETLAGTTTAALDLIGDGAERTGPDRDVPLLIHLAPTYRQWRDSDPQRQLVRARVLWTWAPGTAYELLAWAMEVETTTTDSSARQLLIGQPDNEIPSVTTL